MPFPILQDSGGERNSAKAGGEESSCTPGAPFVYLQIFFVQGPHAVLWSVSLSPHCTNERTAAETRQREFFPGFGAPLDRTHFNEQARQNCPTVLNTGAKCPCAHHARSSRAAEKTNSDIKTQRDKILYRAWPERPGCDGLALGGR